MSKNLFFVLSIIFLAAAGANDGNDEKYERLGFFVIGKINNGLKQRNLPPIGKSSEAAVMLSDNAVRNCQIVRFRYNMHINVQFLPETSDVVAVFRSVRMDEADPNFRSSQPQWTSEHAVEEARSWYEEIIGSFPGNVGPPQAAYAALGEDSTGSYGYEWTVAWPRVGPDGVWFLLDSISVTVNERLGITSVVNNFVSEYSGDALVKVSETEAVDLAKPQAKKILSNSGVMRGANKLVLHEGASAKLWIVNPNKELEFNGAMGSVDLKARLAWVVSFRASDVKGADYIFHIWVDAETKQILGGDFG